MHANCPLFLAQTKQPHVHDLLNTELFKMSVGVLTTCHT